MEPDIVSLINDFISVACLSGKPLKYEDLRIEVLPPPHKTPSKLPLGFQAVYIFIFNGLTLKVGKAGPNSQARFTSQHYGYSAPSTLSKSIFADKAALKIENVEAVDIGLWIKEHTTRINIYIPASYGKHTLSLLEVFLHCHLNPKYEGY